MTLPREQLQARSQSFQQRQLGKDAEEGRIVGSYLWRHQSILTTLETMPSPEVNQVRRSHEGDLVSLKGPKFDPKFHALPSTSTCKACNTSFRTFFHLKKHVEASNCLRKERLWQLVDEYTPGDKAPAAADRPSIIAQVALDPGDAALSRAFREQLRERCCLCSQKLAMKGVKQHLNKQHPTTMSKVWPDIEPKLDTFKVMVKKGHKCRFCEIQVDAPGRHVRFRERRNSGLVRSRRAQL